jgi:hypothetical protein
MFAGLEGVALVAIIGEKRADLLFEEIELLLGGFGSKRGDPGQDDAGEDETGAVHGGKKTVVGSRFLAANRVESNGRGSEECVGKWACGRVDFWRR